MRVEPALPSEELIWRVTGTRDLQHFHESGRLSVEDIRRALAVVGRRLEEFEHVLDYGCGCGRILRWLGDLPSSVELLGVDIDADAIAWAAEHVPHAQVVACGPEPPLPFDDGFFDLVFNHSVFTHLPEAMQDRWLAELARITRPGGTLLLTVSGEHPFAGFVQSWLDAGADPSHWQRLYGDHGLVYIEDDSWTGGPFPDFYHSTFHAPWYVFAHWSRFLTLRAYVVRGALDFQDLVVLEPKTATSHAPCRGAK